MGLWTDIVGSVRGYIRLGLTGVRLKNSSGALAVRDAGDSAYAGVECGTHKLAGLQQLDYSADIASGATVDLGTATGNSVTVTHSSGTTAITSFGGASLQKGTIVAVIPSISGGTLTVTHHATNMILLGGADITLASGDVLLMMKNHDSNAEWKHVGGWKADGTAWVVGSVVSGKVRQIVFANKTDTFSTASSSFTDLTGMSVSLTPTNASNKVALFAMMNVGANAANFVFFKYLRDSTDILIGDTASSRLRVTGTTTVDGPGFMYPLTMLAVDSPGDTSAHTYKVQMAVGGGTGYINRTATDTNSATWPRAASTLIAMEYEP